MVVVMLSEPMDRMINSPHTVTWSILQLSVKEQIPNNQNKRNFS